MRTCMRELEQDTNKLIDVMIADSHIYNQYFNRELSAQEQNDLVKLIADKCSKLCIRFTDIDLMYVLERYAEED